MILLAEYWHAIGDPSVQLAWEVGWAKTKVCEKLTGRENLARQYGTWYRWKYGDYLTNSIFDDHAAPGKAVYRRKDNTAGFRRFRRSRKVRADQMLSSGYWEER